MTKQAQHDAKLQRAMRVGSTSIEVDIDDRDRIMWITERGVNLHIAVGLEGFKEFGYNVKDSTLSIVLHGALQYLEIPCTMSEAKTIVSGVGWDIGRLVVQTE